MRARTQWQLTSLWHVHSYCTSTFKPYSSLNYVFKWYFSTSTIELSVIFLRWHFFISIITQKPGPKWKMEECNPDNHTECVNMSHVSPYIRSSKGICASVVSWAVLHIFLLELCRGLNWVGNWARSCLLTLGRRRYDKMLEGQDKGQGEYIHQ